MKRDTENKIIILFLYIISVIFAITTVSLVSWWFMLTITLIFMIMSSAIHVNLLFFLLLPVLVVVNVVFGKLLSFGVKTFFDLIIEMIEFYNNDNS